MGIAGLRRPLGVRFTINRGAIRHKPTALARRAASSKVNESVMGNPAVMANKQGQPALISPNKKGQSVDWEALLARFAGERTLIEYGANRNIFRQGEPADSVFYLRRGKVKLAVISAGGKEAIVAILGAGEFFGEGCLAGQALRISTVTAMTDCSLVRIAKPLMARVLHERRLGIVRDTPAFAQHPIRRGPRRSTFQLEREASGPDSLAPGSFWKGK